VAVNADQLPALLDRSLSPAYLLAGTEALLVQECRDQVIKAAQAQGFVERTVHDVAKGFDWARLSEESAAPSLFSSRKIIDVRLPTGKPGADGARALVKMVDAADPDVLLLVSSGAWGTAMRKLKWVTAFSKSGVLVEIWPVKPHQLPGWIRNRMARAGLQADNDAISLLAELVEGNLLAAQQEIDKLVLAGSDQRVTVDDVSRAVANSARFDSFRLVECVLEGQLGECLRVAAGLKRTGVPIQVVSGALYRELMVVDTIMSAMRAGENQAAAFSKLRIWPARQGPIKRALSRLSVADFGESFKALSLIDRQSKGRAAGDDWQTLDRLLWFLCDPKAVKHS
jgi:DNA polymerase-3 subunit delta